LRNHQNVREAGFQAAEIERTELAVGELQRRASEFGVRDFMKFAGEAKLVEDFHDRRMDSVAAEFSVEVLVHFEEGDLDAATSQEESKDGSCRAAADDATSGSRGAADVFLCSRWFAHDQL
jgi:hypothetical protein